MTNNVKINRTNKFVKLIKDIKLFFTISLYSLELNKIENRFNRLKTKNYHPEI